MSRLHELFAFCGIAGMALGCGVAAPEQSARTSAQTSTAKSAIVVANGRELNGRELNGRELNGRELNGRELNGVSFGAATVRGVVSTLALDGSELVASSGRTVRRGTALAGAMMFGHTQDGLVLLRVDTAAADGDVFRYQVSFANRDGWRPLCGRENDGTATAALALSGTWDYRSGVRGGGSHRDAGHDFTFACEGYALAKCVALGYAPWRSVPGTDTSLAAHHQACTRMLRADYCGDGTPYTQDGTLIDVYDGVGLQSDTESWKFEAEWSEDGAECLATPRRAPLGLISCAAALQKPGCGALADFHHGALLMSEAP